MASELPPVPIVGEPRHPSMLAYDEVVTEVNLGGLHAGKRVKPISVHFTPDELVLIETSARWTAEDPARFIRRIFFAELQKMYP